MPRPDHLLTQRCFAPLFLTQFLGAFNDNLFKTALVVLVTFQAGQWTTLSPALVANLAAAIFILPFVLFSATAGELADQRDRASLARATKLLEVLVMALGAAGFMLHSLPILLGALFLMGVQSTLFGPVKYALLPQHLPPEALTGGNAWIEAGTFVAILLGTLGGALLAALDAAPAWSALASLGIALAGYLCSRAIPAAPPPDPGLRLTRNPLRATGELFRLARQDKTLWPILMAISGFWLVGAVVLAQFPALARDHLGGHETTVTLLLAVFTLGIGLGAWLCDRLSGPRLRPGLVVWGGLGMSLAGLDLGLAILDTGGPSAAQRLQPLSAVLADPSHGRILLDLMLLGLSGGLYVVPLYTRLQAKAPAHHLARLIAANNLLNAVFMVGGAVLAMLFFVAGGTLPGLLIGLALAHTGLLAWLHRLDPGYWQSACSDWQTRKPRRDAP